MASKRESGAEQGVTRVGRKHRGARTAGRVAVRREPVAAPTPDTTAEQVRERIDAALAEALRMREAIEQRIESRLTQPLPERDRPVARRTVRTRSRPGGH